jgi:hypothetical protein
MATAALSRVILGPTLFAAALALAGCWTAPVATVQPKGEPRLIQSSIAVRSANNLAVVQSVDPSTRTIVVQTSGTTKASTYKVGHKVSGLNAIKPGDVIEATLTQELTIYVLLDGLLPGIGGSPESISADARVLSVDPSYRLLTLQYANGGNETFKVPLAVELKQIEAGDSVVIRPVELVALRRKG